MRKHDGNLKCPKCKEEFRNQSGLDLHLKLCREGDDKIDIEKHECDKCGKKFGSESQLKFHMGKWYFVPNICYQHRCSLGFHQGFHRFSKVLPNFKCPLTTKKFMATSVSNVAKSSPQKLHWSFIWKLMNFSKNWRKCISVQFVKRLLIVNGQRSSTKKRRISRKSLLNAHYVIDSLIVTRQWIFTWSILTLLNTNYINLENTKMRPSKKNQSKSATSVQNVTRHSFHKIRFKCISKMFTVLRIWRLSVTGKSIDSKHPWVNFDVGDRCCVTNIKSWASKCANNIRSPT